MYRKKIPFDIDCGVKIAMEVIGGKWKSCIIQELDKGPKRPSELHRYFDDASPRVINQQLKELEIHGMIQKKKRKRAEENLLYSLPSFSFSGSAAAVLTDDSARSRKEVAPISFL